jgi:hippurate hydrolase
MIDDGLFEKFPKPDVILGQHVNPAPAGTLSWRQGVVMAASDSLQIRLFGRGAHGSMPQASIDPVVMAASLVMRLQTIVSREIAPADSAVLTVGSLQAGTKENVIPQEAVMKLNVRSLRDEVRQHLLDAIRRIANAEAEASAAPQSPEITVLDRYSLLKNDADPAERVVDAFRQDFPADCISQLDAPVMASEEFGCYGSQWHAPSFFWFIGGTNPSVYAQAEKAGTIAALPANHSPKFAPVLQPTLETGIKALVVAGCAWLSQPATS